MMFRLIKILLIFRCLVKYYFSIIILLCLRNAVSASTPKYLANMAGYANLSGEDVWLFSFSKSAMLSFILPSSHADGKSKLVALRILNNDNIRSSQLCYFLLFDVSIKFIEGGMII